ncbi:MAG: threonylcarbamoyl-AMP synthase [Saprospiraceae bacterium]|nr:threonylcarbamoyl-AMP synthase [Saprospiraceae bacterium]
MIGTDIYQAAELLRAGQLVAIPTETVYGLAGNALNEEAVAAIFAVKQRPTFDPLIVHVADMEGLEAYCRDIPADARRLAGVFMPGPLTLLLPKKDIIPDLVTAGSPLVALRMPAHPLAHALLSLLPFPLAAPSANPFGYISPTTAQHVADQLGDKIPYILDGGPCEIGLESTIVGWDETGSAVVYRKGGVAVEAIEALIGPVEIRLHSSSNPLAPGMLKSHYAPRVPLLLGDIPALIQTHQNKRLAILSFSQFFTEVNPDFQMALSPNGDIREAARHLFGAMRYLDSLPVDCILAELLPEEDLGRAVNDRLRRAAAGGAT